MTSDTTSYTHSASGGATTFSTLRQHESEDGFSSEWWISRKLDKEVQLIMHLEFPIFGHDITQANQRADFLASEVIPHLANEVGGLSDIITEARAHTDDIQAHLTWARSVLHPVMDSPTGVTVALYRLATQFHATVPAQRIALVLGIENVRTIHDRLQNARERGELERPGQGRSWT